MAIHRFLSEQCAIEWLHLAVIIVRKGNQKTRLGKSQNHTNSLPNYNNSCKSCCIGHLHSINSSYIPSLKKYYAGIRFHDHPSHHTMLFRGHRLDNSCCILFNSNRLPIPNIWQRHTLQHCLQTRYLAADNRDQNCRDPDKII